MAEKPENIPLNYKLRTWLQLAGVIMHFFPSNINLLTGKSEWRCALLSTFLTCTGEVLDLVWLKRSTALLQNDSPFFLVMVFKTRNRKTCFPTQPLLSGFYIVNFLMPAIFLLLSTW